MKRNLLFLAAAMMLSLSATAQKKGDSYLGVSLGYNTGKSTLSTEITTNIAGSSNTTTDKSSTNYGDNLSLSAEYGYFVANNLRVGANLGYGYAGVKGSPATHSLTIMPNVAYYVELVDGLYFTPNLSFGYGMSTQAMNDDDNLTMNGFVAEFQPFALEFRPTSRMAMTVSLCSLQYAYLAGSYSANSGFVDAGMTTKYRTSSVGFDLLANAQVGFKYYF